MALQRQDRAARAVDRRLMAGIEQQDAGRDQLVLAQPLAHLVALDQSADQIRAGLGAPLGDHTAQIGAELDHGGIGARLLGLGGAGLVELDDLARPVAHRLPVVRRHAQHLADHRDRQRLGELRDEIEAVTRRQTIEAVGDDRLHPVAQILDPLRREGAADHAAQPGVVGWLLRHHVARFEAVEIGLARIGRRPAQLVARQDVQDRAAEAAGAQDLRNRRIGQNIDPVAHRIEEHRHGPAQLGQARIGIGEEIGSAEIERVAGDRGVNHAGGAGPIQVAFRIARVKIQPKAASIFSGAGVPPALPASRHQRRQLLPPPAAWRPGWPPH